MDMGFQFEKSGLVRLEKALEKSNLDGPVRLCRLGRISRPSRAGSVAQAQLLAD
jgi:hypothetical protein